MQETTTTYRYRPTASHAAGGGIFFRGFAIMARNWRCLAWMWFINLVLAGIATIAFSAQAHNLLDHSEAARNISHTLDLSYVLRFATLAKVQESGAAPAALALDFLFAVLTFIVAPGVLAIYLGDEIASLGNMLRTGLRFFWRFVRFGIVALLIAAVVLAILHFVRTAFLKALDPTVGATKGYFWLGIATFVCFYAVVVFFRVWFDLSEVVIVDRGVYRLGQAEDRRAVRTLGPGWKLLFRGFWRVYFSFVLIGTIGWFLLLLSMWLWRALPPFAPWRGFLLSEIGLLFLLGARFWQRGMEVAWFEYEGVLVTPIAVPVVAPPVYAGGPDVVGVPPADPTRWPSPDPEPTPAPGAPIPQPPRRPPADIPPAPEPPEPAEPGPLPGTGPAPLPA